MRIPHWAPRKVSICGIEHDIIFIGKKRMKREMRVGGCFGGVDANKCRVYLAERLLKNPTLLRDTLIHEVLGHCLWNASGIGHWMQTQIRNKKKFYEFQEVFVRWHTPLVITTLREMGFLKETK